MNPEIELLHFAGCPNVEATRKNLAEALGTSQTAGGWKEWDLEDAGTPERVRRYGSPTVLVDGVDVSGTEPAAVSSPGSVGLACSAHGAPTVDAIRRALNRSP